MRSLRTLVLGSLAIVAVMLPAAPAAAGTPGKKAVAAVNKSRAKHGLRPLGVSPSLGRSARRYAVRMLRRDFFGHGSRISASRHFRRLGETLGLHSGWRARWRRMVRAWMRSPSHRRILLSRRFTCIGVGYARGRMGGSRASTWVAHFDKR